MTKKPKISTIFKGISFFFHPISFNRAKMYKVADNSSQKAKKEKKKQSENIKREKYKNDINAYRL